VRRPLKNEILGPHGATTYNLLHSLCTASLGGSTGSLDPPYCYNIC